MTSNPTETTFATILWSLYLEDRPMNLERIANAPTNKSERLAAIRELLARAHVRFTNHQYEITRDGADWLHANKQIVADAVLEAARECVPNSVFQLART